MGNHHEIERLRRERDSLEIHCRFLIEGAEQYGHLQLTKPDLLGPMNQTYLQDLTLKEQRKICYEQFRNDLERYGEEISEIEDKIRNMANEP